MLMPAFTRASVRAYGQARMFATPQHGMTVMSDTDKKDAPRSPRETDEGAADHIEKKPQDKQSPQQTHDDESHG
jgi:hypothetical protein